MKKSVILLFAGALLGSGVAIAKLPPPTIEEQEAAAAKKAQEQAQLEKAKAQLERVQDRLAAKYATKDGKQRSGQTSHGNMPQKAITPTGAVGPKPARPDSGEAHSAPAK